MTSTDRGNERDFGTLEQRDGEVTLRFTRLLPHPAAKVWRALTEPEHLEAWFPTTVVGERVPGAPLRFGFREGQLPAFEGAMLAFDPPKLLELIWGDERLRFELAPNASGTLLIFTASFTELGRAARDAAGWHVCLDLLGCGLSGERAPWGQRERWQTVHGEYVTVFGPEAATVGPPE